jgi:hypothetical protein
VVDHAPDVIRACGFGKTGKCRMEWTDWLRLVAVLGMAYGAWVLWRRQRKP